ncbi:hypothetical protein HN807_06040 [Candidatus Bathyarchaeota archaeon]|nr:hypothetical protein [Candidatus Bathyarchaeota archaeon]MBT4319154.1 hypothetical protein [Candidatus Bathyarchaeota archaeon]MBT4423432.1 hypothetical protein [Candidatus Bathyarchaeota archaeon]MBT6605388.1 hypothetical protein [Candidatus Bathyarchaeota archaeon]MBT7186237.1 hypothetical protein [Candidatus Bathyarchaeota archaeon]
MAPVLLLIDYIRTALSIAMLGYASYKDFKTREIHDYVWLLPALCGAILGAYELFMGMLSIADILLSVGFMAILSGVLWYFRLFGEADLLAFVALSIIHPRTPSFPFMGYPPLLFSFTLIANSALSGLLSAFYTLSLNLSLSTRVSLFEAHPETSKFTKLGLMFTGHYRALANIRGPPFEYPLEEMGELVLKPDIWDDDKANKAFKILKENGRGRAWVSATLPYIVPLFVGYMVSVVYGDIMFTVMAYLSR